MQKGLITTNNNISLKCGTMKYLNDNKVLDLIAWILIKSTYHVMNMVGNRIIQNNSTFQIVRSFHLYNSICNP